MAITTLKGHVSRAYDFYNKPNKYFGIGKTTPWDNEMTPPTPTINDDMVEVVGYKLIESLFMVIPDDNGELVYRDTKWKIVPADQAYEKGARWVYVSTHVSYTELTTNISYRQIGLYTNLEKAEGVPTGKSILLPSEVGNPGILEVLDNRPPIYREADQREQLVLIIEF